MSAPNLPSLLPFLLEQGDNCCDLLTIGQVAHVCNESQETVRSWIENGWLAVHHVRTELRISVIGLAEFWVLRQNESEFRKPDIPEAN